MIDGQDPTIRGVLRDSDSPGEVRRRLVGTISGRFGVSAGAGNDHKKREEIPFLTIDEASSYLRVSRSWLRQQTRMGSVPHLKPHAHRVLFEREALLTWFRGLNQASTLRPSRAAGSQGAGSVKRGNHRGL